MPKESSNSKNSLQKGVVESPSSTQQKGSFQSSRSVEDSEHVQQEHKNVESSFIHKLFGFLASKWMLGVCFVLLLLIGFALGQETYRKYNITREIQEQRSSIQYLERGNREMTDYVAYLQTDNYRERVARERLGKKREGEEVVVVPEQYSDPITTSYEPMLPLSNPQKWWQYFFGSRS